MSDIISSPMGISLPYSSLFSVPSKETSKRRSPQYFWDRAVATSGIKTSDTEVNKLILPTSTSSHWDDDVESTAWIDCEDDEANELTEPGPSKKKKSFAKIRKITFRSVVAKGGSKRVGNVVASELVSQQVFQAAHGKKTRRSRLTVFRGWRIKSKGSHTQVKKLVAVVRHRISNKSDEDQKPKTWEEYHRLYAMVSVWELAPHGMFHRGSSSISRIFTFRSESMSMIHHCLRLSSTTRPPLRTKSNASIRAQLRMKLSVNWSSTD